MCSLSIFCFSVKQVLNEAHSFEPSTLSYSELTLTHVADPNIAATDDGLTPMILAALGGIPKSELMALAKAR